MIDRPWFIYRRQGDRIRYTPASWQGWLIFLGGLVVTIGMTITVMLVTTGEPFIIRLAAPTLTILIGVGGLCLIAIRKGRPSR